MSTTEWTVQVTHPKTAEGRIKVAVHHGGTFLGQSWVGINASENAIQSGIERIGLTHGIPASVVSDLVYRANKANFDMKRSAAPA